ncbi:GH35 family beta-galactosidase [Sphingomonas sp. CLY1604]|uniref:GH35 family beta-galactosidase n=1 Tax=Sphingomonas sp. CLY1604 TaxID=3457786 RepID=UPI003FD7F307
MMRSAALVLTWASMLSQTAPARADTPRLERRGEATQLVVNGEPKLLIAGELSNSAASSAAYMAPHWPRLRAMHLNTVLAPVSWELVEPQEGRFDWASLDAMIQAARANDLKLVLLWFGAYKNSMSTYVPGWVKRDQARFPRAALPDGQSVEILSTFGAASLRADARAFAAMLAHLKAVDGARNTVVMVQVENEIGMLPVARDHSPAADAAFAQPVPQALIDYLVRHRATLVPGMQAMWTARGARTHGSWTDLFGEGDAAAEVFAAWHYARFADTLAAAGKAAYPLPMYVNVALNRPGRLPGQYPSGGPLPHLIDVWKAGAPSLDLLAPDIYFPNFTAIADAYHRPDNPLFVPEAHNADNPVVPANAFYAFGQRDAIGFGPFSIDSVDAQPGALAGAYAVLRQLERPILAAQATGRIAGFKPHQRYDESLDYAPQRHDFGGYRLTVAFADIERPAMTPDTAGYGGMVIQTGPDDFLIAGQGITVTFTGAADGPPLVGIERAEEGTFDAAGQWTAGRVLNGDQTHQGRHIRLPPGEWGIQKVRLYRYR